MFITEKKKHGNTSNSMGQMILCLFTEIRVEKKREE